MTLNVGTGLVQQDDNECLNMPVDIDVNPSSSIINPIPINIKPHSDLNVLEEEVCASSTNFRREILMGVKSQTQKLFEYKVKLKAVISKIGNLTKSTYTLLGDEKSSEENDIFVNEIKDTSNYLVKIGQQFIDRATAMEIVSSTLSPSEHDKPPSEEDDVIYISTEHVKYESTDDDKKKVQSEIKGLILFKWDPSAVQSSFPSSENDAPDNSTNSIPVFKHKHSKRKGEQHVWTDFSMDFANKSELCNHYTSHTNI